MDVDRVTDADLLRALLDLAAQDDAEMPLRCISFFSEDGRELTIRIGDLIPPLQELIRATDGEAV